MSDKNEVFEYLIDCIRHQVNNNPYKQQCEDLAREVQSLKNQLRDASAQIKELHVALVKATGDAGAYKLARKGGYISDGQRYVVGGHGPEPSGCRKEDTQAGESWAECDGYGACPVPDDTVVDIKFRSGEVESNTKAMWWSWGTTGGLYDIVAYRVVKRQCHKEDTRECEQSGCCKEDTHECHHNWRFVNGKAPVVCINCGVTKSSGCEHEWQFYGVGFPCMCIKCGLKK
ncbi:hypothetical protein QCF76_gp67 [Escherichia phage ZCEC5]|uniref:hypothetical protein n=1 Tax=Escherichia phage ZCEC5 TaxID=2530021 RepID=UPI0010B23F6A|nr:hypothetical protein QCF76_gp67 [Escherichia phage ZCEC5]QBJ03017.1 hypothetical protein [Escherichia phage ZCEC5]